MPARIEAFKAKYEFSTLRWTFEVRVSFAHRSDDFELYVDNRDLDDALVGVGQFQIKVQQNAADAFCVMAPMTPEKTEITYNGKVVQMLHDGVDAGKKASRSYLLDPTGRRRYFRSSTSYGGFHLDDPDKDLPYTFSGRKFYKVSTTTISYAFLKPAPFSVKVAFGGAARLTSLQESRK